MITEAKLRLGAQVRAGAEAAGAATAKVDAAVVRSPSWRAALDLFPRQAAAYT